MNFLSHIKSAALLKTRKIKIFYAIFYAVGVLGLSFSETRPLFIQLVPFALLLGFAGVLLFHESNANKKTLLIFSLIFIAGFAIESIGVNTGLIFGNYQYGKTLGFQFFETPVIIGLNWLFLVYVSASATRYLKVGGIAAVFFAPLLMVIYDVILEQVAPGLEMWNWKDNAIPLQNYIAWFVIALLFHLILRLFKIKIENRIAPSIFAMQFLFFLALFILKI